MNERDRNRERAGKSTCPAVSKLTLAPGGRDAVANLGTGGAGRHAG